MTSREWIDVKTLEEFENSIPHTMRFKEYSLVNDLLPEGDSIYWVTQEPFTEEDLEEFSKNLNKLDVERAYVTFRDISKGMKADMSQKNVIIVNRDGIEDFGNFLDNYKEAFPQDFEDGFEYYLDKFESFKELLEGNMRTTLSSLIGHYWNEFPDLMPWQVREGFDEAIKSFIEYYFE